MYGLFKQKIVDGWQMELPDVWLPGGEVWLSQRTDLTFKVKFDGHIKETWTEQGLKIAHYDKKKFCVRFFLLLNLLFEKYFWKKRHFEPKTKFARKNC